MSQPPTDSAEPRASFFDTPGRVQVHLERARQQKELERLVQANGVLTERVLSLESELTEAQGVIDATRALASASMTELRHRLVDVLGAVDDGKTSVAAYLEQLIALVPWRSRKERGR
jgi:hypothetical protein